MADIKKDPRTDDIKRPLYFTSQFLLEGDFTAEQVFHDDLRRLHNLSLHTWGIVKGLEVSTTSTPGQVTVSAGMAIDSMGQEIVLTKPQTVPVSTAANLVTIKFSEALLPEDKYTGTGLTDKFTRATPRPQLEAVASAPNDGSVIKLGQVNMATTPNTIDGSMRVLASSRISANDSLLLKSLNVAGDLKLSGKRTKLFYRGDADTHIGSLAFYSPDGGKTAIITPYDSLGNNLAASAIRFGGFGSFESNIVDLAVSGKVGIGTPIPTEALEVNGRIKAGALTIGPWPANANYMFFGTNALDQTQAANYALLQSSGGGDKGVTFLNSPENIRFRIGNADQMILTKAGNVGIGTAAPTAKLEVRDADGLVQIRRSIPTLVKGTDNGGAIYFGVDSAGGANIPTAAIESSWGGGALIPQIGIGVTRDFAGGKTANMLLDYIGNTNIRQGLTSRLFVQGGTGNVGIGTPTPAEALEVNGRVKAGVLTVGPWPANPSFAFFGANTLDHTNAGNYALLQSTVARDVGATYLNSPENIKFRIGNVDQMILTKDGNFGIGTTAPEEKLHLNSSSTSGTNIRIVSADGHGSRIDLVNTSNNVTTRIGHINNIGVFQIGFDNSSPALTVIPSGNVGIGTTTPAAKLDVLGAIRAGGSDIYFTEINHNHTGIGNAPGVAAIENATNFGALMILGRNMGTASAVNRVVKLWDFLEVNGNVSITGNLAVRGAKTGYVTDQFVNKMGETLELGDVVVIGANQASLFYGLDNNIPIPEVDLTEAAYDTRVCGIVCKAYGRLASDLEQESTPGAKDKTSTPTKASKKAAKSPSVRPQEFTFEELEGRDTARVEPEQIGLMATLGAFAHCKVDADIAPINVGDLLTTSPTKGHAQKVLDPTKAAGSIIGKALGSLKKGKGKIPVIVTL
jgi:hypothetical protein